MKNGFVRVACASPSVHLADPVKNTDKLIRLTKDADAHGAALILYPELCITGYTCGDLFLNDKLITSAKAELKRYLAETQGTSVVSIVGLPLTRQSRLYNCAAVCQKGELLGIIPKTNLPNCETRYFTSASALDPNSSCMEIFGKAVDMTADLLFSCSELPNLKFGVEICQDFWEPTPPSAKLVNSGATVICNPAASSETVEKQTLRRDMIRTHGIRNNCCYLYASCGEGESTTDQVYGGYRIICEGGEILAEAQPFDRRCEILYSEIDVDKMAHEQRINAAPYGVQSDVWEKEFSLPITETVLTRFVDPHPFYPADKSALERHCETILNIQAHGLKQRMEKAYAKKAVIGISGGLDSTLALLVAARTVDLLGRPRSDILAVTMPCFGTTNRTKNNATVLCEALGVEFRCVSIGDSVTRHFKDIGHDPSAKDVTYENSQARERTQVLMDIANGCGGIVIGTGDLSELALGWATYNGDHMSMYGVNADVPKTLIRHIVAHCAETAKKAGEKVIAEVLSDILDTPVSPELLPADEKGEIAQKTEDLVGPYELHDFYLYNLLRYGFSPEKIYRLAKYAFGETYSDEILLKWLEIFLRRFFNQQFKRSCLPDGPAVCEIGLSPRGAWRMPSDASSAVWLDEVATLKASVLR